MTSNIVNVQNEQTHTDKTIIALIRTTYILYSFICYFYMMCSSAKTLAENDYKKTFEGLDRGREMFSVYFAQSKNEHFAVVHTHQSEILKQLLQSHIGSAMSTQSYCHCKVV